ncbi:MAG: hypothetical protein E6H75_07305 [Betaproteobacteria bacterium]|nr:MAG: hypothetical protein E6H75_07305 [Betaproteobacteria bacterium]
MMSRFAFSLFIAALALFPALSHAGQTQWETIRVYTVADGPTIAVAVPAEWQALSETRVLGTRSALRFEDETGALVEVPVAALLRASAGKRVLWAEDTKKIALKGAQGIIAPGK